MQRLRRSKGGPTSQLRRLRRILKGASTEDTYVLQLPNNKDLQTAITDAVACKRDARSSLRLLESLKESMLLSLASPVGVWDPLDIKPQVFRIGPYCALPVFTTIGTLQHFCDAHAFTVRDPGGQLWAFPGRRLSASGSKLKRSKASRQNASNETTFSNPEGLLLGLNAVPLPTYGMFERPFFVGYFADTDTLFHNLSVVPEKVDIVVDLGCCSEMIISRDIASQLLRGEVEGQIPLLQKCYKEVEKECSAELAECFGIDCPEVMSAKSLCVPWMHESYRIWVGILSEHMDRTLDVIRRRKHQGTLKGHQSLHFVDITNDVGGLVSREGHEFYSAHSRVQGDDWSVIGRTTSRAAESPGEPLSMFKSFLQFDRK